MLVSGRSSSREGHRLAKELLQSLKDVDEDSMDIPLSSVIAHSQALDEEGIKSDDDIEDDLPEDPGDVDANTIQDDGDSYQEGSHISSAPGSDISFSRSASIDRKQVAERMSKLIGSKEDESEDQEIKPDELRMGDISMEKTSKSDIDATANTDTESSSFIGFPRRRPIQKQKPIHEQNFEMEEKDASQKRKDEAKRSEVKEQKSKVIVQETEFTAQEIMKEEQGVDVESNTSKRQNSPLLYSNSPRALKNLNANMHQSPSKDSLGRTSSSASRASSTVSLCLQSSSFWVDNICAILLTRTITGKSENGLKCWNSEL